jgi:SAM-dependent methyltransferase
VSGSARIISSVERYYTGKLREHGPSPRGVDWNSEESQNLRFEQLLRVCPPAGRFSLLDYGCGYGALLDHLGTRAADVDYRGFDISEEMVRAARARHGEGPRCRFSANAADFGPSDYAVASGIFNVALGFAPPEWSRYVSDTLDTLRQLGTRGFAFNMLTSYSDADRMRSDLHYGDPAFYFDLCKRRFSRNVALLHDYDLYEFTLLVRL